VWADFGRRAIIFYDSAKIAVWLVIFGNFWACYLSQFSRFLSCIFFSFLNAFCLLAETLGSDDYIITREIALCADKAYLAEFAK